MNYLPLIVVVDDNHRILENFQDASAAQHVNIEVFETWDLAQQYLESNEVVDGLILDAKGKLTADRQESEAHLLQALNWVSKQEGKNRIIPYAIHTAYYDELETFSEEQAAGKMFKKQPNSEAQVLVFLKKKIAQTPKLKIINHYPEPFQCFGTKYLDKKYENLLLNVIQVLENDQLTNPEDILFNPCRILLERVFEKINEIDEKVLPYALLKFDVQRAVLVNCYKHLSGIPYYLDKVRETPVNFLKDSENEFISKTLDLIVTVCHPASHDIQKYTPYTFKSVLYATFDVLIWLKEFIDERK